MRVRTPEKSGEEGRDTGDPVEQTARSDLVHGAGADDRTQRRAGAEGEHQRAAGGDHLARGEQIVGRGQRQRVEDEGQRADQRGAGQQHQVGRRGDRDIGGDGGQERADAGQHRAPADAVGQPAQWPLQQQPAGQQHQHEGGDLRQAAAAASQVERAQREHRAGDDARHRAADHADLRARRQLAQGDAFGRRSVRLRHVSERDRDQRHDVQHAGGEERSHGARIEQRDQRLAGGQRQLGGDHVDGQGGAARLRRRALVQPALDDHEHAGHGEAGQRAQRHPCQRIGRSGQQQDRRRRRGGHGGKDADVADAPDQWCSAQGAGGEAHVVGAQHRRQRHRAEALGPHA